MFVSIDAEGRLLDRSRLCPAGGRGARSSSPRADTGDGETDDGPRRPAAAVQRAVITVGGRAGRTVEDEDDDDVKPLPDRLVTELTAHRTLALRDALANNPRVAFQAVLHNFVLTTFYRFASSGGCLEIAIRTPAFPLQAPG